MHDSTVGFYGVVFSYELGTFVNWQGFSMNVEEMVMGQVVVGMEQGYLAHRKMLTSI